MSHNAHYLCRVSAILLAVMQLAVVPATHVLHVGCHGAHYPADRPSTESTVRTCGHCCSCKHHANEQGEDSQSPGQQHDSDSCAVCKAAFAVATADFVFPPLPSGVLSGQVTPARVVTCSCCPHYRLLGRGPPVA